ncbi:MAG: UDP-2,3-diacylglucosamine diphosphatase [Verrucomicrobiales bacterium]
MKPDSLAKRMRFRTIFISDVHLGTPDCKAREVIHFLKNTRCEKLVLNGDIIDAWHLRRRGAQWDQAHTHFLRTVLKKMEKDGTQIIYLRGNHDDILWRFLPFKFDKLEIVNEHIHEAPGGERYLVVHGDGFDQVTTNHRWLAVLGSVGYSGLLRLNRLYNFFRRLRGKEYFSLAKAIKARVKSAVSFVGKYEDQLQGLAKKRGCEGIICGHIHTPDDKQIGDVRYINSGDWVETMSAIVEQADGTMEVLLYTEFKERLAKHRERRQRLIAGPMLFDDEDDEDEDEAFDSDEIAAAAAAVAA